MPKTRRTKSSGPDGPKVRSRRAPRLQVLMYDAKVSFMLLALATMGQPHFQCMFTVFLALSNPVCVLCLPPIPPNPCASHLLSLSQLPALLPHQQEHVDKLLYCKLPPCTVALSAPCSWLVQLPGPSLLLLELQHCTSGTPTSGTAPKPSVTKCEHVKGPVRPTRLN